ncbi:MULTISPECIES: SDR family oxidoreductase [unclassified Modestobacter]|uniref:SDR family oxidoreductase n=1 Tax=unclassified Modestobacter TaxID=2643866 RepID=UPI0022AA981D|nr:MULTISPECIES: SDR family oxidoreductase [unclassified Modestobacter]MCZ2826892.1 SDR family oxidoreductase [Modestobacter sp. VKM Ac-2981]MCZ2855412.1 SDR family oxidoreductase [Modestobacter sp. VKM Ac-2982]
MTAATRPRQALVVGATGIVGQNLAERLTAQGWEVHGLSRSGRAPGPGVHPVQADLADPAGLATALAGLSPELVAITAWTRQATEAENIAVNGAAVRNVLQALEPAGSVRHAALMTGLKHYLGPFEAYAQGEMPDTPFHEDEPRLDAPNFYYAQEDELFAAAARAGFTWSVHRSHTVFGFAVGNAMNMVLTLSAYAAICKQTGRPFVFPGSSTQWNSVTDVTDADLLADQIIWAAATEAGHDQAFNTVNGDVFRWRWLWPQIAAHFGVGWEGYEGRVRPLTESMAGSEDVWAGIAAEHELVEPDLGRIASWWHTDSDLGREIEVLTDMNKSRKAGFTESRDSRDSFFRYVERYRAAHIIP